VRLYLDHASTTPLHPAARAALLEFDPRVTLAAARARLAAALGLAESASLLPTLGGSLANGLALEAALAARPGRTHLISQRSEHSSVLRALEALERRGCRLSWLDLDPEGRVDPAQLDELLRPETAAVSVMTANHETGALQPLAELHARCRAAGVLLHTDATQGLRTLTPLAPLPADLISFAGHKHGGPRGVGAVVLAEGIAEPRTWPASPPHVLSLAAALEEEPRARSQELARARDELEGELLAALPGARRNGPALARLPGHLSISVPGLSADALLLELDLAGLALSSGAACSSADAGPSHVLLAMGLDPAEAGASLRFSLAEPLDRVGLERVVAALRAGALRLRAIAGAAGPVDSAAAD